MKIRVIETLPPMTDPRLRLAVCLGMETALRISEITSLKIEDLINDQAEVNRLVRVRVKGKIKGKPRFENVYLTERARAEVKEFIGEQRSGWLLQGLHGSRLNRTSLLILWKQAQEVAGWPRPLYRFHDIRHTAITRFYNRTLNLVLTMQFARHRSLTSTEVYTHTTIEDLWKAMEG